MAASITKETTIAKALNSARNANINDEKDLESVENIIQEYFTTPALDDTDGSSSSGESEASDDEENASALCIGLLDQLGSSDEEENDPPLIEDVSINNQIYSGVVQQDEEKNKVVSFDCRCSINSSHSSASTSIKKGCIGQFTADEILGRRLNMQELTEAEKDMIFIGILAGNSINSSELTNDKPCRRKIRKLERTTYTVNGKNVCREAFKFIYGISQNKLTNVQKRFRAWRDTGSLPEKKWGGRRFNSLALKPYDVDRVVTFLRNFAKDHALVLPGRIPGFKRSDVKILPSSQTKAAIWRHYRNLAVARGQQAVGKSSFFLLWKKYVPFIVVGKPMTDLCWQCKQNNERIRRSVNMEEEERMVVLGNQMAHLQAVEEERRLYNGMVQKSKTAAALAGITELGHQNQDLDSGSNKIFITKTFIIRFSSGFLH